MSSKQKYAENMYLLVIPCAKSASILPVTGASLNPDPAKKFFGGHFSECCQKGDLPKLMLGLFNVGLIIC
jgi:hypothetical protein